MDPTTLPTGATAMIEMIALAGGVAGGFALWLWRKGRRIQQMAERR